MIFFITQQLAQNQLDQTGKASGEHVFYYWIQNHHTRHDIIVLDRTQISSLPPKSIVVIDQSVEPELVSDLYKLNAALLVYKSHANTPQFIVSKLDQYHLVLHNNNFLYQNFQHDRLIYFNHFAPLPDKQIIRKKQRFLYIGNSSTYQRKQTHFKPYLNHLDIFGDEGWKNLFPNNYKGSLPLDQTVNTVNQYAFPLCLHKDINRSYGEPSLMFFMALNCNCSYITDLENFYYQHDPNHVTNYFVNHVSNVLHAKLSDIPVIQPVTTMIKPLIKWIEGKRYFKHFFSPGETLYSVLGPDWKQIYDLDVNEPFREICPDPNSIKTRHAILIPS